MVGLGFAMIENVGYYINALITPERGGVALLGYTFVLAVLIVILVADRGRVTGLIVAYLPGYEATGLVTAGDVAMLAPLRALALAKARRGVLAPAAFTAREGSLLTLM